MEKKYLKTGSTDDMTDHRSYAHNLNSGEIKAWNWIQWPY